MKPQRKVTRLQNYDYTQRGAYFVTVCVHRQWRRKNVWGEIRDGVMQLNRFGRIVEEVWYELPQHHRVELDEFVVMPNHVHGILKLSGSVFENVEEHTFGPLAPNSLSSIVGAFKSAATRRIGQQRDCPTRIWQPRFHERIIRDEAELNAIRRYIIENPLNWHKDKHNPSNPDFRL
jgi:REP element-mobilizing transposase RayT